VFAGGVTVAVEINVEARRRTCAVVLRETRSRAKKKAESKPEELSPERRAELAHRIEAKRFRGKPPSI
jgi:hypothetical protein